MNDPGEDRPQGELHGERCRWCGRVFVAKPGPGRPRRFCKQGCRQASYIANKLAAAHGLDPDQVIVERRALDDLLDRRYQLELAYADVQRARAKASDEFDHARHLSWLAEHVEALLAISLEPGTPGPISGG
ncbi:MAG: hypothetical protein HKN26_02135 [Acidimicrobiales bacterium]|nr:hypothetical protein [Acidimicrobiales bacterium]